MMNHQDFLVELGCEELPPKALKGLAESFFAGIRQGLDAAGLKYNDKTSRFFATPRRLAVLVTELAPCQPDRIVHVDGPPLKAAFDAQGQPTAAALGFAKKNGIDIGDLDRRGEKLRYSREVKGLSAALLLPGIVSQSLEALPIPKRMRWGNRKEEFVRPVHWLLMMYGNEVVPAQILGLQSGCLTFGHRFMMPQPIQLAHPAEYEHQLEKALVIADIERRRSSILEQVRRTEQAVEGIARIDEDLLEEVTALVEWPVALIGHFENRFLSVPQEALISTMEGNQKYFPVLDGAGRLMPHFIFISNIDSPEPFRITEGNERVVRPRLTDAEFFFNQDKKKPLAVHNQRNEHVVFQAQLGSLLDKAHRNAKLAASIAGRIGGSIEDAERAGLLSKADLTTEMVGEFPELQGIMGFHYAMHDNEGEEVALALNEQYQPRFAGDCLPTTRTGSALALADKLDTLTGIFGIGQHPTGSADPFALRRAALGVLRIIIDQDLRLDIETLIQEAMTLYGSRLSNPKVVEDVFEFFTARYRAMYEDLGISADVINAVVACRPTEPADFDKRVKAVSHFQQLPEALSLAAANKRVSNIIAKESISEGDVSPRLLTEKAEKALYEALIDVMQQVEPSLQQGDYTAALSALAGLREVVDAFFDEVMVMAEDMAIRQNRLRLLKGLRNLFLRVADISLLQSNG